MDAAEFAHFRHTAVHELMRLNENCEQEFRISSWPRWDYDLELGTLTFSQENVPRVIASIEVVGTTSTMDGTWLWSWANESLPTTVTKAMEKVRAFGETENIDEIAQPTYRDDEYLGWAMTAIAAKVLGAKGAYRCPGENGFVYFVYSSLRFASQNQDSSTTRQQIPCATHASGIKTYVCEHLISNPTQKWFSASPDNSNKWPDAWCAACDVLFQQEGEWNDKNESKLNIKLLCHHCYEQLRSQENSTA